MNFRVALLQIASCGNDPDRNLAKGIDYCRQAKALSADLVVFPELWNIGASACPFDAAGRSAWFRSAINQEHPFFRAFVQSAQSLDIHIAITYLETNVPKPRNSVSLIDRTGGVALHYSKVFICDFGSDELAKPEPNAREIGCDVYMSPGNSFDVCTLEGLEGKVTVGAMICADREFPEPAGRLVAKGAELITVPNACNWDEIRTGGLKTRAFENLVGVAMANYPDGGHSQVHTCVAWKNGQPQNTCMVEATNEEEIVLANFNLDEIRAFRRAEAWRMAHQRSQWR